MFISMKATELPLELMAMRHYSIPPPMKSLQHGDTLCYLRIIRDADILAYGEVRVVGAGESRAQGRATVWHDDATSPPPPSLQYMFFYVRYTNQLSASKGWSVITRWA